LKIINKILLLLVFLLSNSVCWTQNDLIGKTVDIPENIIPPNWQLIEAAYGDINNDKLSDCVLAIKNKKEDEEKFEHEEIPRLLIFLTATGTGFKVTDTSSSVLLCKNCGGTMGDPFSGININEGKIHIYHYGGSSWRWTHNLTFEAEQGIIYLVEEEQSFFNVFEEDSTMQAETKTFEKEKRIKLSEYSIYKD
jgi:hypothetical protein